MPTSSAIDFDASLPVIDREQLEMLLMADEGEDAKGLVREIYQIFRDESDEKLTKLEAISAANDHLELRNLVHFIAGSAGNLGMLRLHAFYRGIEESIDTQKLNEVAPLVDAIRSEYTNACEAFEQDLLS